jgi:hypothetical protein
MCTLVHVILSPSNNNIDSNFVVIILLLILQLFICLFIICTYSTMVEVLTIITLYCIVCKLFLSGKSIKLLLFIDYIKNSKFSYTKNEEKRYKSVFLIDCTVFFFS